MLALPDYQSCRQGGWQDCWLLSAAVGLAFKRPAELAGLFEPLDDGSYRVSFPGREGLIAPADSGSGALSEPWPWASAMEAAAAQLMDAMGSRITSFGIGIELLTGHSRVGFTNFFGFGFAPGWILSSRGDWCAEQMAKAAAERRLVVLGGSDGRFATPKQPWISPRHCYAVLDYDRKTDRARLRDPHGNDDGRDGNPIPRERKDEGYGPGEFWLSAAEIEASFCGLSIEAE